MVMKWKTIAKTKTRIDKSWARDVPIHTLSPFDWRGGLTRVNVPSNLLVVKLRTFVAAFGPQIEELFV